MRFRLPVTRRLHADESFLSNVNGQRGRVKTVWEQSYWSVEDSTREKRWILRDGKGWKRKETGWRKRVRGRRGITSPAVARITKRERGRRSKAQPSAFLIYCRIFRWFQSRMSHLALYLFRYDAKHEDPFSFPFSMYACQLAKLDSRNPRERIANFLWKDACVGRNNITMFDCNLLHQ